MVENLTWSNSEVAKVYESEIQGYMRAAVRAAMRASPENIYNRHQLINCMLVALTKTLCEIKQAIDPSITELGFAHQLAADLIETYEQYERQKKTISTLKGK